MSGGPTNETRLGSEDSVQKNFYANYERTAGILILTKGNSFRRGEGFMRKTYK